MAGIGRRQLLGSTAAAIGAAVLPRGASAQAGPPVARVAPVTETLWGTQVTDPYRWMESKDAEWQAYAKAEAAYAANILSKIPGRQALFEAIERDTGAVTLVSAVQTGGDLIFTEVRQAGGELAKLYTRTGIGGRDRLLIDPDRFAPKGSHAALDWWAPSPDGSHVAFGISPGGSEQSTLHIMVTATGALLPETMDRTPDANPSWLPDGTGFFYNRLQAGVPRESPEYEEKSVCWFHRLNHDPKVDQKFFGEGLDPAVAVADIDFPGVGATPGSDILIGSLVSGVQIELSLYAGSLTEMFDVGSYVTTATPPPGFGAPPPRPEPWTKICGPEAKVTGAAVLGDSIYLQTHLNASRYRVVKTTAAKPAFADAVEVVPESTAVIRGIVAARDGIYIQDLDAGLGGLRRLRPDGTITQIKLPFSGSIDALYADTLHDGAWFSLEGWVRPTVICYVGADGAVHQTGIAPQPPIDVTPYTSEEIFAVARDGVKVPLSVVWRKSTKLDGSAPLVLWAYGAYGITEDPSFIARWLPLLDQGGIFALAHVRGGGELGEDWHLAGKKLTKPNTWRDLIACAETLIARHFTSSPKLAIMGGSAGGITVGMFMTERPDLAAVVIDEVGVSNPLRSEFSPNGPPNIPEFGTVKDREGFKALYAMDTYQHIRNGVKYPSVLALTGLNDPRVEPWEPTKLTARLQGATASVNPVLLRVDTDAGHGYGSTRAQRDKETADIFAFVLWRTGDPRYQPR